jgi:hypothetical protein
LTSGRIDLQPVDGTGDLINLGSLKRCPRTIMAQAIRAILLASATELPATNSGIYAKQIGDIAVA